MPPDTTDDVLELDHENEGEAEMPTPEMCEQGNLTVALTALANGFGASAQRRTDAADQLALDSQRMWAIAMTTPTVLAAKGIGVMTEAGSGRTRAETNNPGNTAAPGGV